MKLTGSATEQEYREDLLGSRRYLFESSEGQPVLDALRRVYGPVECAYVLSHTPEQGEDVFRIVVDGKIVLGFSFQRDGGEIQDLTTFSVKEYQRAVGSKEARLRLAIALNLTDEELANR